MTLKDRTFLWHSRCDRDRACIIVKARYGVDHLKIFKLQVETRLRFGGDEFVDFAAQVLHKIARDLMA